MADRKHVVRDPTPIGVMAVAGHVCPMVEQRVEDVEGFAGGRRDNLGGERRVTVGKVGVEFDPRLVAVMGVEARGGASASGGPEELAV
jgi:hypothetical protein